MISGHIATGSSPSASSSAAVSCAFGARSPTAVRIVSTCAIAAIGGIGAFGGLKALESLEVGTVGLKLSVIGGLLTTLIVVTLFAWTHADLVLPELPVKKDAIDLASIEEPTRNENSSIATAALPSVEETASIDTPVEAEPVKASNDGPKTAEKLDCKKFFPSVGMTLSVPCE